MDLVRYPPGAIKRGSIWFGRPVAVACLCLGVAALTFLLSAEVRHREAGRKQMEDRLQRDSMQIRDLTAQVELLSARANAATAPVQSSGKTAVPVAPIKSSIASAQPAQTKVAAGLSAANVQQLNNSIATTHEQLLKLERQGNRHYIEFNLSRTKDFQDLADLRVQLHKVDQKHSSYNISIVVGGHRIDKPHVNLFEPIWIPTEANPVQYQLVVNGLAQNQISGYLSEAKSTRTTRLDHASGT